ncbi:4758_t:CDS:2 [Acaulospora colombiana]|uniref:4758_t:CDS:1 n=1 Tax=Acaulospora colombiana TaxID=27376 RepID=A0ACA9MVW4_9GLOM|nr:4758_t:CDS:2 [Acaulospora colombiana]
MAKRNHLRYLGFAIATLCFFYWALNNTSQKPYYSTQSSSPEFFDNDSFDTEIIPPQDDIIPPPDDIIPPQDEHEIIDSHLEKIEHDAAKDEVKDVAKAAFVVLIRNGDLYSFRPSMRELEDRFNRNYNYPYVFLNDEPFTEEFKKLISAMTKAKTEYGLIPKEHWSVPERIDMDLLNKNMTKMQEEQSIGILFNGDKSYFRFESGFFYRHSLLDKYDYYWRVEPGVRFYCDIDFDPFVYMRDHDIKYGFTISLHEYPKTIPTLWDSVKEFSNKYPELIEKDNLMEFISNDNGETYNLYVDNMSLLVKL